MNNEGISLTLTPEEIEAITHVRQPAAQLRHLRRMGIKAERRRDGTICVLREWLYTRATPSAKSRPTLKSERRPNGQTA